MDNELTPPLPSEGKPPESIAKSPERAAVGTGASTPVREVEIHHPDGRIEHPLVRRETKGVPFGPVLAALVIISAIGAGILYVDWVFFAAREARQANVKASTYPLASAESNKLPAKPRLDPLERMAERPSPSIYQREMANQEKLNSYGPADESGYVHIPIQQAMKLIVPKLKGRLPDVANDSYKSAGLLDGGGPNSGRVYREAQQ